VMEFDRVKARIDHASYGYSGFFDVLKIGENDLDKMLSFDGSLIDDVEALFEEVKSLKEVKPEGVNSRLEAIRSSLSKLEENFNERNEKILGVK